MQRSPDVEKAASPSFARYEGSLTTPSTLNRTVACCAPTSDSSSTLSGVARRNRTSPTFTKSTQIDHTADPTGPHNRDALRPRGRLRFIAGDNRRRRGDRNGNDARLYAASSSETHVHIMPGPSCSFSAEVGDVTAPSLKPKRRSVLRLISARPNRLGNRR